MKKFIYQLFEVHQEGDLHGQLDIERGFFSSLGKVRDFVDECPGGESFTYACYRYTLNPRPGTEDHSPKPVPLK